jgi:hypothetical protein
MPTGDAIDTMSGNRPISALDRAPSATLELIVAAALFIVVSLGSALLQPQITVNDGRGWDGNDYYKVAEQIVAGQRPTAEAPFVYRLGGPFLAAKLAPSDLMTGFKIVNLAANALTVLLLVLWFRRFVADRRVRIALLAAFVLAWHGPIRFFWFYPVASEHLAYLANMVMLLGAQQLRERISLRLLGVLGIVAFLGATARETALLAPAALPFLRGPLRRAVPPPVTLLLFVPLLAGVLAFALVHAIGSQTNSYGYLQALVEWIRQKSIFVYVLGWWNAYGPILALPLFAWRGTLSFLRANQMLALFLLAATVLGWIGGQDTERYVFWAAPVVYVLVGRASLELAPWLSRPLVAVIVAAQALAERVFLPIPQTQHFDPLTLPPDQPVGDLLYLLTPLRTSEYFDLWSFWMPRLAKAVMLAEYTIVAATIVIWLVLARRRSAVIAVSG